MSWQIFQCVIIFAVVGTNIQWEWTPNPYAATAIGIGTAYVATCLVNWSIDLTRFLSRTLRTRDNTGSQ